MAALLNSLSIGFRYMAVNRDSKKILKLLSAVKTQYSTLSRLIGVAAAKLESARKANDELQHRTDIINKRLSSVEELDREEAGTLLGDLFAGSHSKGQQAADSEADEPDDVNDAFEDPEVADDVTSHSGITAKLQSTGKETEDFL